MEQHFKVNRDKKDSASSNDRYKSSHIIEFNFTCEALFKDGEEYVVWFEFLPPTLDTLVFAYRGKTTLDGTESFILKMWGIGLSVI